ncbi:MAG TPA: hypothetical protein PKO30_02140 [Prolixibacteraceae bacterium]|nr:hypothetical protein [Prolixibacteraceae bacterium]
MGKHAMIILVLAAVVCGGCTSTRYLSDKQSIDRQHDMRKNRTGTNVGDVLLSFANMFISGVLNTDYEITQSERAFKRICIINQSADTLIVNMVTDIVWKETGYCDIMGIVLPPGAKQKLLAPYPAAYNVYFRTPYSEEEKLEIRTDNQHRRFALRPGMTNWLQEKEN